MQIQILGNSLFQSASWSPTRHYFNIPFSIIEKKLHLKSNWFELNCRSTQEVNLHCGHSKFLPICSTKKITNFWLERDYLDITFNNIVVKQKMNIIITRWRHSRFCNNVHNAKQSLEWATSMFSTFIISVQDNTNIFQMLSKKG